MIQQEFLLDGTALFTGNALIYLSIPRVGRVTTDNFGLKIYFKFASRGGGVKS